ncbi:C4-dicarboxylate transporter/malic acid transport protein [Alkaliphilus metalliredigens QYMF]|uniref:C4-dicarboxylate transporter/malic acid transport protein n=1 Tax=Alkaliphilus metalliredigens (strain QYMF) TaxID=293826 RepID=A6TUH3_ALKMQ|nr:TDT family transporter [Alkaliphilus metalliredigens]ABR49841.1 C4-dicarboxylate transporter/malic acid transport protein [Alkaliphilus metalliredigens QYMF]
MMRALLKKIPIPMAGLMLALAATGNLMLSYGSNYRNFFGFVSGILLILLTVKVLSIPKSLREGFENPVIASVMPTFSMGLMLLSTYILPYAPSSAYGIWLLGLIIHIFLIIYFTKKYILNFNIKKVFPSYFIVYVGIVAGSVTAPAFGLSHWGQYIFWFGLVTYLILLPFVLYRVLHIKEIPEPAIPTITIFAAPASLCLAGYLNSFPEKSMVMVGFLGFLSLVMFISVMIHIPKMLKSKFYPSYSAFTFPFVITAIATKGTNAFLLSAGISIPSLVYLVKFLELWSVGIVLYVLARYIFFLTPRSEVETSAIKKQPQSN